MSTRPKLAPVAEAEDPKSLLKPVSIAGMYQTWTLDCVVEAATAIAHDYRTRYRQYRTVPENIGEFLANMKSLVGFHPLWPNKDQRTAINIPLLGPSDAEAGTEVASTFCEAAKTVRDAAIAYSERVFDTGEPMLRQAFVDAAKHFFAYLKTLDGSVVQRAWHDTQPMFQGSTEVLSDIEVAKAFGLPPAPKKSWPSPEDFEDRKSQYLNGDGAYLVEEVSRALQQSKHVTQQAFLSLQRAAVSGARAIHFVLQGHHDVPERDDKTPGPLKELIGDAYSWATALRDLQASQPKDESTSVGEA